MNLSRRTWLWTSTAALAAACTRPGPTKLPLGADGRVGPAEPPRPLTRRGADNLIALAELGAAIRWLHPSDQATRIEWEPLLLDGVRSIEAASSRAELVEGLRGLFGEVAPTVVIWRSAAQADSDELDEPACPDPDAKPEEEPEAKSEDKPADEPVEKPDEKSATPDEPQESRARPAELTHGAGRPPDERPKPPVRTAPGEPSDAATQEPTTATPGDAAATQEPTTATQGDTAKPEENPAELAKPEEKPAEPAKPPVDETDAKEEPPPPLPESLFAPDEALTITQWFRRGYADGLADDPGCAQRVEHDPQLSPDCVVHPKRRRRRPSSSCAGCDAIEARPLAPAAPLRIELPRGLSGLIPLGLWTRAGQTLPATPSGDPAPGFGEVEARDYSLDDRGTRLLVVLRAWSLLRRFNPQVRSDARALLLPALCAAAEAPSPVELRATVETLLAGFADGNAELIVATGRAARRYIPGLTLAWVEERVVVIRSDDDAARPGDVVTRIDGVSIDTVLAERRVRSPAATPSAAIVRTVARLLERDRKGTSVELSLLRTSDEGERELSLKLLADRRSDRASEPADLRPERPIVELEPGCVYVDATRVGRLASASRRLRNLYVNTKVAIVDLRGELADPRGSLLPSFAAAPIVIATERMPTGPDPAGELPLEPTGERRVAPDGPRLRARVIVLADARTRGRAELELAGFDQLGATIVGSASAGDLGGVATAWLPGGWQLRFTHSELRRPDGARIHGLGISPTIPVAPTVASVRSNLDVLLAAARTQDP